jgi:hypothetical protein|nr:hypothetical protein [uncultured Oscillibacter sp.]
MESSRLKNIIILILLLVNVFLLASLVSRRMSQASAQRQAAQQLTDLFASAGVTLDPDVISKSSVPPTLSLSRSDDEDRKVAAFFLGDALIQSDDAGDSHAYDSSFDTGSGVFRSNGSFDLVISYSSQEDPEALCSDFCRRFDYQITGSTLEDGTGIITATQEYNGYPVADCTVTFYIEQGVLQTVSGSHLPKSYTETGMDEPLSASAALTRFLEARRESGAVFSAVTDMYPCYDLQSTASAPMTLVPAWCIVTDTVNYYVNCSTGAVSRA